MHVLTKHAAVTWNTFARTYLSEVLKGNMNFYSIQIDCPKQRDSTSCGVLACMLGRNVATRKTLMSIRTDSRSIAQYRVEILETLNENKDTERCCSCRQHDDPTNKGNQVDRWVQCSTCSNWFHFGCMKQQYHASDEEMNLLIVVCSHCKL